MVISPYCVEIGDPGDRHHAIGYDLCCADRQITDPVRRREIERSRLRQRCRAWRRTVRQVVLVHGGFAAIDGSREVEQTGAVVGTAAVDRSTSRCPCHRHHL